MSTTSLRKIEIKFISILSLCILFWAVTPDAFAVSGKNKSVKSVVKTANKSAPKTAGRTSQAPTLNTLLNGLGAPNATDGIDGDFYLDTLSSNLYGPKKKGKWPLPKSLVGPVGPQGPVGKQGSEGKVGDKGASTSSSGSQGVQGIQGPQGPQGLQGIPGTPGAAGSAGPSGAAGAAGSAGPQGPAGSTGAQGVAGTAGSEGARGPIGETGLTGADGPQGSIGPQGSAGPSRAVLGNINFVGNLSGGVGVGKESSEFGDFQTGKKYLVISNIFTTSASTVDPSLGISISVIGAALTPISKFITNSGNGYRLSNEKFEYGVQVFTTVDASATSGPNFNLKATIFSGANTSATGFALVVTGFYLIQEVGALA